MTLPKQCQAAFDIPEWDAVLLCFDDTLDVFPGLRINLKEHTEPPSGLLSVCPTGVVQRRGASELRPTVGVPRS